MAGCATSGRNLPVVTWPKEIRAIEGLCDLTINWKDVKYSGEMSLRVRYPHVLNVEVYGPFGDTLLSMKKDDKSFLMKTSKEEIADEGRFREIFHITTEDFIEDITMKGVKRENAESPVFTLEKDYYKVDYDLSPGKNKICWIRPEGNICIRFLEVNFDGE